MKLNPYQRAVIGISAFLTMLTGCRGTSSLVIPIDSKNYNVEVVRMESGAIKYDLGNFSGLAGADGKVLFDADDSGVIGDHPDDYYQTSCCGGTFTETTYGRYFTRCLVKRFKSNSRPVEELSRKTSEPNFQALDDATIYLRMIEMALKNQ